MSVRRARWVLGNWKMNGGLDANQALLAALRGRLTQPRTTKVGVAVPAPYLAQAQGLLQGTAILWGGQDVSAHASGAYTGQVSGAMLKEFGASFVLVGHSERRTLNHETDAEIAAKASAALTAGLVAVVCVGETLEEREVGQAEAVVARQLEAVAPILSRAPERAIVAYEPVWAIGTGRTATAQVAQDMHACIRAELSRHAGALSSLSILYGGSVKASNARELFAQPDIDGGLIGGASLVAEEFLAIVDACV